MHRNQAGQRPRIGHLCVLKTEEILIAGGIMIDAARYWRALLLVECAETFNRSKSAFVVVLTMAASPMMTLMLRMTIVATSLCCMVDRTAQPRPVRDCLRSRRYRCTEIQVVVFGLH
jgi:hypothetical protein